MRRNNRNKSRSVSGRSFINNRGTDGANRNACLFRRRNQNVDQRDEDWGRPFCREETISFNNIVNLVDKMLQSDYLDNLTEDLLKMSKNFIKVLNDEPKHDNSLNEKLLKVILKASKGNTLEINFHKLLKMILGTQFAIKTIDSLISTFLPMNPNLEFFYLLTSFLKLTFEILPGMAYDLYYYRVENLKILLQIQFFKENISSEGLLELEELSLLSSASTPFKKVTEISQSPPDDFRNKSIFPKSTDLLNTETKDVFLRKNISKGAYESVDDYLDIQFRLMHEDFIQPLREGINEYKNNNDQRSFNVKVYKNVRLLNSAPNRRLGIIQYIQLDTAPLKRIKWSQSKRLLFGSLLVFSWDNFITLYFATVANRDDQDIKEGILAVKFINVVPCNDKKYIMLETMNMFESYKHVLAKLQETNESNLCMKNYLVFAERNIGFPYYFREETRYCVEFGNFGHQYVFIPAQKTNKWPKTDKLRMNTSQLEAFKSALTKEITIIQGPPGTGKTYLGLKICSCLVANVLHRKFEFGPILVVCYTNHALDQFLEGISKFTDEIVRIGGQCKSVNIQKFSLYNWKVKKDGNEMFGALKFQIHEQINELEAILDMQNEVFKSIIKKEQLRVYISQEHFEYLEIIGLKQWLYGMSLSDLRCDSDDCVDMEVEEIICEEVKESVENIVNCLFKASLQKKYVNNDDEIIDIIHKAKSKLTMENLEKSLYKLMQALSLSSQEKQKFSFGKTSISSRLLRNSLTQNIKMSSEEVDKIDSLDSLSLENRWRLYKYWVFAYVRFLKERNIKIEEEYEILSKRLNQIQFDEDESIMKKREIIGMTTSGAARYRQVLENIGCKIIIVEEAAEVLESHIISSLNSNCQHLILMGDHKQLRPSPAVYELSVKYSLDLSLFERLVNNKLEYNTLSVQHRMRPEIADIIRFIYPNLQDAPVVYDYPNIPSVRTNIFFYDHYEQEELNQDIVSYSNVFEAEFIVKFCRHLIENGVDRAKITILTLYSGQKFLLTSLMDKVLFKDVLVCVVDNYQGEENDIILLSLVRSNSEERIGFAGIDNRICVSLSRAKHGLYVFGNFDLLSSKSKLWRNICQHLIAKKCLGKSLNMFCQNHPEKQLIISNSDDFNKYPDYGCEELCNGLLKCGHICKRYCHFLDKDHEEYECMCDCTKSCSFGHNCPLRCYEGCRRCEVQVSKVIPNCNHTQLMPCYKEPEAVDCLNMFDCPLVCGHISKIECSLPSFPCILPCEESCWHNECNHPCGAECSTCVENCQWKCEHAICTKLCEDLCDREVCNYRCRKNLDCMRCGNGFQCYGVCGERCRSVCIQCDPEIEKNTTYITLWTCEHSFKLEFMDKYMDVGVKFGEISRKRCPQCQILISGRSSFRYMNIVKRILKRVKLVQKLITKETEKFEYSKYKDLLEGLRGIIIRMFNQYEMENYFLEDGDVDVLYNKYQKVNYPLNMTLVYRYKTSLQLIFVMTEQLSIFYPTNSEVKKLIEWVNPEKRKFDKFEKRMFIKECERLKGLIPLQRRGSILTREYIPPNLHITISFKKIREARYLYLKDARWSTCFKGHLYNMKVSSEDCPGCVKT